MKKLLIALTALSIQTFTNGAFASLTNKIKTESFLNPEIRAALIELIENSQNEDQIDLPLPIDVNLDELTDEELISVAPPTTAVCV